MCQHDNIILKCFFPSCPSQFSWVCTLHVAKENVTIPQLWIKPKVGGVGALILERLISLIFKFLDMISIDHRGELGMLE